MATDYLLPASDVLTEWTNVTGSSTHYGAVDDPVGSPDDLSTYIDQAGNASGCRAICTLSGNEDQSADLSLAKNGMALYSYQMTTAPDGGAWTIQKLKDCDFGVVVTRTGLPDTDYRDRFGTDNSVIDATIGSTINSVTIKVYGDWTGSSFNPTFRISQVYLEVDHSGVSNHPAPDNLQADFQTNPTAASEDPNFTAIFNANGGVGTATQAQVQLDLASGDFSSPLWDSGFVSIDNATDGQRSSIVQYGGSTLSSAETYKWRIKFKDSGGTESLWSTESATVAGFVRAWPAAFSGYRSRRKLYWDTPHKEVPAGYVQRFTVKTGLRKIVADDAYFNEAVQASGGFQVAYFNGRTHYVYLANYSNTGTGQAEIRINTLDHQTGQWGTSTFVCFSGSSWDTHFFPVIAIDDLGYIHVCVSGHYSSGKYIRSKYPNVSGALPSDPDPDSEALWINPATSSSTPATLASAATYPILFWEPSKSRLYLLVRYGSFSTSYQYHLYYTDNRGASWSGPFTILYDRQSWDASNMHYRVYAYGVRYDETRQRLHVSFTFNQEISGTADTERGVWYMFSDLDDVVTGSAGVGFDIWRTADGSIWGYTEPNTVAGSPVAPGWSTSKAIILSRITDPDGSWGEDTWGRIFTETLELDADGEPIVFYERKFIDGTYSEETWLEAAKWSAAIGQAGSWSIISISDQVNLQLRVRRSSIAVQTNKDGEQFLLMPVNGKTHADLLPTGDASSTSTTSSEATNYEAVDDGIVAIDGDGSYIDIATNGQALFSHAGTGSIPLPLGEADIIDVRVEAIVKEASGSSHYLALYLNDGSTDDDGATQLKGGPEYDEFSEVWDLNPFTSSAWQLADLASIRFGVKAISGAAGSALRVTRLKLRIHYTLAGSREYFASELWLLRSRDGGLTWSAREISRNSGIGVPIMNHKHHLTNDAVELIWVSGHDLFYFTDRPWGLMQRTGKDFRIAYAGAEIDRILDYANLDESEVAFKVQATIPADAIAGADDYYIYSDNPTEDTNAAQDPAAVYLFFESWELRAAGDSLPFDGWSAESGSASVYSSPPSHANKIFAGEKALQCAAGDYVRSETWSQIQIDFAVWLESTGGDYQPRLEIEDGTGSYQFGVGYNDLTNKGGYYLDGTWYDIDHVRLDYKHYYRFTLWLTNAGGWGWARLKNVAAGRGLNFTQSGKIRFHAPATAYLDYIRVSPSIEPDLGSKLLADADQGYINVQSGTNSDALESYDGLAHTTTPETARFSIQIWADTGSAYAGNIFLSVRFCQGSTWDAGNVYRQDDISFYHSGSPNFQTFDFEFGELPAGDWTFKVDYDHSDGTISEFELQVRINAWTEYPTRPQPATVTLQAEELKGWRFDAVLQGAAQYVYNLDAVLQDYRTLVRSGIPIEPAQAIARNPRLPSAWRGYLTAAPSAWTAWSGYTYAARAARIEAGLLADMTSRIPLESRETLSGAPGATIGVSQVGSYSRALIVANLAVSGSISGILPLDRGLYNAAAGQIPLETASRLLSAAALPLSYKHTLTALNALRIEFRRLLEAITARSPIELGLASSAAPPAGLEFRQGLAASPPLPLDFSGAVALAVPGRFPIEDLGGLRIAGQIPEELLEGLTVEIFTPAAFGAGHLVNRALALENKLWAELPASLSVSYGETFRGAGRIPLDASTSSGSAARFSTELLAGHLAAAALPVEWIGAGVLRVAGQIPLEARQALLVDRQLAVDTIGRLAVDRSVSIENRLGLAVAPALQVETSAGVAIVTAAAPLIVDWLSTIDATASLEIEGLGTTVREISIALELSTEIDPVRIRIPIEGMIAALVGARLPLEWSGIAFSAFVLQEIALRAGQLRAAAAKSPDITDPALRSGSLRQAEVKTGDLKDIALRPPEIDDPETTGG